GVADADDGEVVRAARAERERAHALHGLEGVLRDVHERGLERGGVHDGSLELLVALDDEEEGARVADDVPRLEGAARLVYREADRLERRLRGALQELVQVGRLALDLRVAREREELGQEAVELVDLAAEARREAHGVLAAALPLDELGELRDGPERVPDLVREAGREAAD